MHIITRLAAAAALISTLAFSGPSVTKDEQLPSVFATGPYALLHAENHPYQNGFPGCATFAQYEVWMNKGYYFGTSGLFAVDGDSTADLIYEQSGVTNVVALYEPFTWATYTASTGNGNAWFANW